MQKAELYRHYARQAIETAEKASSKYEKASLLEIAQAWLGLANSAAPIDQHGIAPSGHLH